MVLQVGSKCGVEAAVRGRTLLLYCQEAVQKLQHRGTRRWRGGAARLLLLLRLHALRLLLAGRGVRRWRQHLRAHAG